MSALGECLRCKRLTRIWCRGHCGNCGRVLKQSGEWASVPKVQSRSSVNTMAICVGCEELHHIRTADGYCRRCADGKVRVPRHKPIGCFAWDSPRGERTGEFYAREMHDGEPCLLAKWDLTGSTMWTPEAGLDVFAYEETPKAPKTRVRGVQTAKTGISQSAGEDR